MKKNLPLLIFLSAVFISVGFIENDIVSKLLKGLWNKINNSPQEKVYITTDRPHYLLNDTLWFAAWLTDATFHEKDPVSQLLYVQLVDNNDNILKKVPVPIYGKNGSGYIPLNFDLSQISSESFSIQAYTSYMLNEDKGYIFSREIKIWKAKDQISTTSSKISDNNDQESIRFFPEGGNMVIGIDNNIAFEVTPHDFSNHAIVIKDDQGNTVTTTRAPYNGMGVFSLKPEKGKKLHAILNGKKFDLPEPKETGYNLIVNNRSDESIKITAQTNLPSGLNGSFIICHQRGEEVSISEPMSGQAMAFRVNKKDLKDGVALITLFDKSGKPLAERSVFIYNANQQPDMKITQNYEYYNTRSLVELNCNIIEKDSSLQGRYSVSVTDLNQVNHHADNLDIRSYFLLSSELPRSIKNPGFYFTDFDSKKNTLLDIAMMVHGWSRIKSEDLLDENEKIIQYAPERGVTIAGRVVDKDGKGLPRAKVDLSILDPKSPYFDIAECGKNGTFIFYDVPLLKNQLAYLKAYEEIVDKKKKNKSLNENVIIQLEDPKTLQFTSDNESNIVWAKDFNPNRFMLSALEKQQDDSSYAMIKITLEEVEIKSYKSYYQAKKATDEKIRMERGMAYNMYDSRIFLDSLNYVNANWTVMDIVANHSPGATLLKRPPEPPLLTFRNKRRPPAYFLDGFPVDYNAILNVDINTVEFIDVLRSSMTAVAFGDAAYGGAVLAYTRRPGEGKNNKNDDIKKKNIAKFIGSDFLETREFYSPDHSKNYFNGPDNRITLFWSPLIKTDDKGNSKIRFYTGDRKSKYLVKIEGMTVAGKPFVKFHTFDVK